VVRTDVPDQEETLSMCLPTKSDQPSSSAAGGTRPILGIGALMLLACLAGPVVRRLIDEVVNAGRIDVIDELYAPHIAEGARRWIAPFLESFPDVQMEIVDLIAEGEKVVGRFRCSADHRSVGDRGQRLPRAPARALTPQTR
jgi:hypothetical protein